MPEIINVMGGGHNEENEIDREERERAIGVKVLLTTGFDSRHKDEMGSSLDVIKKWPEGRKPEIGVSETKKKMRAFLELLSINGRDGEQLMRMTMESMIVKPEDIGGDYWRRQEQILRDEGQGRTLSKEERDMLTDAIRKEQRESLEPWFNYLSHEECPYPDWFKVYALDGVSRMGVFDRGIGRYKERDKHVVAPYPHLNQAVLGRVYEVVEGYYGNTEEIDDEKLRKLVKSGNFNKLYSYLMLSQKIIVKTPEKTEDVRGEWVEYGPGDEEKIASAADGTPWCVAAPAVARSYLSIGRPDDEREIEDGDESRAKFYFFHLYDGDRLADNASASIRLDPDGNVAEISGIKGGNNQEVEDALVPIVEEKVRTLPGGEKFLARFSDKKWLIEIDRKIKSGEEISYEDFRFIMELDRPIERLNTYGQEDSRLPEFREYGRKYAVEHCYIIPDTKITDIEGNLVEYIKGDPGLTSNLLTYAIKKGAGEKCGQGDGGTTRVAICEFLHELGIEPTNEMLERIENLETYETQSYVFLLPKDQWTSEKIELPEDSGYRYIAPGDLTAVLKKSVAYDWKYETDGEEDGWIEVYDASWVGREIRHFPWSKEVFEAEEHLIKPEGYEIPQSWRPVLDAVRRRLAAERGVKAADISERELRQGLTEQLKLSLGGCVHSGTVRNAGSRGYWWTSTVYSATTARNMALYSSVASSVESSYRYRGFSLRCLLR